MGNTDFIKVTIQEKKINENALPKNVVIYISTDAIICISKFESNYEAVIKPEYLEAIKRYYSVSDEILKVIIEKSDFKIEWK